MPDLEHTLHGKDFGFLKMTAGLWGIEVTAPDASTALPGLVKGILNGGVVEEVVESLPAAALRALHDLVSNEGHLPWPLFSRRYGEVRVMGAARRDRERPDLYPASPTETLWYRGLIGQAFLNLPPEPQEYAYIPDDLLALIHLPASAGINLYGQPAPDGEIVLEIPADDRILDHACTLLAGRRLGLADEQLPSREWRISVTELSSLLFAAGLLDSRGLPRLDPVREFLESPREAALALLARAWLDSEAYNDLRLLPGLAFEGQWVNNPLQTRRTVLEMLAPLPPHTWWSLEAFIADVKEQQPDFQRPAGDYDSWFIHPLGSDEYLRGFASWDAVEGALLRSILCGPLHWLGILDLAAPEAGAAPCALRPSAWADDLLAGKAPSGLAVEDAPVRVSSDGLLIVPRLASRAVRYQLARFGEWLPGSGEEYRYRITPPALARARSQQLKPAHLIALLQKNDPDPLPPLLLQALKRWEKDGSQAQVEQATLLRVKSPDVLAALRKTRAARYILEEITTTIVSLRPNSEEAVLKALAETGYLGESHLDKIGGGKS